MKNLSPQICILATFNLIIFMMNYQAFFYSTNMTLEVKNITGANKMEDVNLPNDGWVTTGSECFNDSLK